MRVGGVGVRHLNPLWLGRLVRVGARRLIRRVGLSQLFLLVAVIVIAAAMLALGGWIGAQLRSSISQGVAATAASGMSSLLSGTLADLGPERPLSPEGWARLDEVFGIGNDAGATRLLQISIRDVDGTPIYASLGGIEDDGDREDFRKAASGTVVASVRDLEIAAVGPFEAYSLPVLKIHAPLRARASGEVFAVAELFYSAASIVDLQTQAQTVVWILMGGGGSAIVGILYVFVAQASRTITRQRASLAAQLNQSRQLSEQVTALHRESERLRLEATLSNERLLAQVGSDLHDGPLQLLTLVILRLSQEASKTETAALRSGLQRTAELAAEALDDIRNISSGLVLPELENLSLTEVLELVISRHEGTTGTRVRRDLDTRGASAVMAVKICCYRIIQEALNNAFWHGDGAAPRVSVRVISGNCRIEVSNAIAQPGGDDGPEAHRLGLRNMRHRVESLGGSLQIERPSASKLVVAASVPLDATATGP